MAAAPIVFFDIAGPDPGSQKKFFADVFGWEIAPTGHVSVPVKSPSLNGFLRTDPADCMIYFGVPDVTATLAKVLHRPSFLPTPLLPLKAIYGGELVQRLLLEGQRVLPRRLEATGFAFAHPTLEGALRAILDRPA